MCKKMVTLLGVFYNKLRPIQGKGNACTIKGVFGEIKVLLEMIIIYLFGKDCFINDMYIRIRGNNKLIIEDGVVFRGSGILFS